jgi:hypothetical protein
MEWEEMYRRRRRRRKGWNGKGRVSGIETAREVPLDYVS